MRGVNGGDICDCDRIDAARRLFEDDCLVCRDPALRVLWGDLLITRGATKALALNSTSSLSWNSAISITCGRCLKSPTALRREIGRALGFEYPEQSWKSARHATWRSEIEP